MIIINKGNNTDVYHRTFENGLPSQKTVIQWMSFQITLLACTILPKTPQNGYFVK